MFFLVKELRLGEMCERRRHWKCKMSIKQKTFQFAPSSFMSSTSAGAEPGLFTFEKLFFMVLMKIHHGPNGKKKKKIHLTDL